MYSIQKIIILSSTKVYKYLSNKNSSKKYVLMYRGHLTRTYSYLKARHRLSYNVNAANCRGGAIFIIKWGEARRYVRMSLRISEWYIVCKTEIRVQASLDYVSDADIDNVLLFYMYIVSVIYIYYMTTMHFFFFKFGALHNQQHTNKHNPQGLLVYYGLKIYYYIKKSAST